MNRRRTSAGLLLLAMAVIVFPAIASRRREPPSPRLTALLLNGGGVPSTNYQSHLNHLRLMLDVLREAGVPESRITILSGDGPDPSADMALREAQPEEDFWMLLGTRLEEPFRTPIRLENSRLPGFALRAATRAEIDRFFAGAGARLTDGDTLLVYVTDHGTKNPANPRDNRITLWGKNESLSVAELRAHLAKLDRKVRTVLLMSQCYSGSFANALPLDASGLPSGRVCGYFSTTPERPAYGCYPETRDRDQIGHSFAFIEELARTGQFAEAHAATLRNDVTPDAPRRTSDAFLEERLRRRAETKGVAFEDFVDGLLAEAWKNRDAWETETRLLDAIGRAFGTFSPRSLAEIREQEALLPEVAEQLDTHARAWRQSLGAANRANLERFLARKPGWRDLFGDQAAPDAVQELGGSFLWELAEFTRADAAMTGRLSTLGRRAVTARSLAYRMEVRAGAMLRMRTILTTIAGREDLARDAGRDERAAYDALLSCEALRLPLTGPAPGMPPPERAPFPAMEEDVAASRGVLPAWMGIRFGDVPAPVRDARRLAPGATSVLAVFPDSPAEAADLQQGDVILGPPNSPFEDPGQIREWTMLLTVDEPRVLSVLRGAETIEKTIVPKPWPMKWPQLPGPPRVSTNAPAWSNFHLTPYRGALPPDLRGAGDHLLYFWGTSCAPCQAALPELLAFENERDTPVVAITDEPGTTLDAFFGNSSRPFPERVAIDEQRRSFLAYAVSGVPAFVLVDGDGVIRAYGVGYTQATGLPIAGWTWSGARSGTR